MNSTPDTSSSAVKPSRALAWFRNDLRILDNPMLHDAIQDSKGHIVPVYCFDPRMFGTTDLGVFPKTNVHRMRFLIECVEDLKQSLEKLGAGLVVRIGRPEEVLVEICRECKDIDAVYYTEEVCSEEKNVEKNVAEQIEKLNAEESRRIKVQHTWGAATLFHVADLPYKSVSPELPGVFTQFRKQVENRIPIRKSLASIPESSLKALPQALRVGNVPAIQDLAMIYVEAVSQDTNACLVDMPVKPSLDGSVAADSRSVLPFHGGESAALNRVNYYLFQSDLISTYKDTRNGMIGGDYSSKFSPWLAHGCVSSRYIYHEIQRYELTRLANDSTYWLVFELIWRDYFRFAAIKYGDRIFYKSGPRNRTEITWKSISDGTKGAPDTKFNRKAFQAFVSGNTGFPYIDANMRELYMTGFMSNRGRQNVASFLTKDLGLDWRLGAEYFESLLLDYDPASNYGNWNYSAGIGDDPRSDRYFSIVKQAKTYDENGDYVRLWIPELRDVSHEFVHEPYKLNDASLHAQYAKPIISQLGKYTNSSGNSSFGNIDVSKAEISKGKKHNSIRRFKR